MRLERGWSIYRLSVEADLPQSTLVNMFSRETQPSIATLEAICKGFGITLSEFFTDSPEERQAAVTSEELDELFFSLPEESQRLVYRLMRELSHRG